MKYHAEVNLRLYDYLVFCELQNKPLTTNRQMLQRSSIFIHSFEYIRLKHKRLFNNQTYIYNTSAIYICRYLFFSQLPFTYSSFLSSILLFLSAFSAFFLLLAATYSSSRRTLFTPLALSAFSYFLSGSRLGRTFRFWSKLSPRALILSCWSSLRNKTIHALFF